MRVPLGETVGRVEHEDSHPWLRLCTLGISGLPRDLDEDVTGDASLVAHLPEDLVLLVVNLPDLLEKSWDDVLGLLGGDELNPTREREVG